MGLRLSVKKVKVSFYDVGVLASLYAQVLAKPVRRGARADGLILSVVPEM